MKINRKMAEWINALVLKTKKVKTFQGSNPCLSKKICLSILSINKLNYKNELIKIILAKNYKFHIDIMEYSYVKNNAFCTDEIFDIINFVKIFKINIEYHIMSKNTAIILKKIKNSYIHSENFFKKNNKISLSYNFCWNYIYYCNFNIILMSVNPGFGNQKFIKKTLKQKKFNTIDGGINKKIFKKIKNYFKKIIIGSNIIKKKIEKSYFKFNYILNEYKI